MTLIITVKRTANDPVTWLVLAIIDPPNDAFRHRFTATAMSEAEALSIASDLMGTISMSGHANHLCRSTATDHFFLSENSNI